GRGWVRTLAYHWPVGQDTFLSATSYLVSIIVFGIFLSVILVILFSCIEIRVLDDRGGNWLFEFSRPVQTRLALFRYLLLGFIVVKYRRLVLASAIKKGTPDVRRIKGLPKDVHQLRVGDYFWVKRDLDRFTMGSLARRHLGVGWI